MVRDRDVYIVKVVIKDHHDEKKDLVSRPFVRAFNMLDNKNVKKATVSETFEKDGITLYCCLENGLLYDIFTQRKIEVEDFDYEIIYDTEPFVNIMKQLDVNEIGMIHSLIRKYIFGDEVEIGFVKPETMEELAGDRAIMYDEYCNDLSLINPYEQCHENDYRKSLNERLIIEKKRKESIINARKHRKF